LDYEILLPEYGILRAEICKARRISSRNVGFMSSVRISKFLLLLNN